MPKKGDTAPDFCLPNSEAREVCLKDLRGKWVALYFYPKDNTKGCTKEALEFTKLKSEFEGMRAVIIGISPDSVESHRKFRERHALPILLLSDPDHKALEDYGVWRLKQMYGREYHGVVRSTFLIDPDGKIAEMWTKVKVKGHAETVQCALRDAQSG